MAGPQASHQLNPALGEGYVPPLPPVSYAYGGGKPSPPHKPRSYGYLEMCYSVFELALVSIVGDRYSLVSVLSLAAAFMLFLP